jgi:hypothetical protein
LCPVDDFYIMVRQALKLASADLNNTGSLNSASVEGDIYAVIPHLVHDGAPMARYDG